MSDVMDRIAPPTVGTPPELPPFLRSRPAGPERRVLILPDIRFAENGSHKVYDRDNNWITIIHHRMIRIVGENIWDPQATFEMADSSMRRYRAWLETYQFIDGIPPHIQFGGAIEAGEGDPTFYPRWREYAKEMFV